MVREAWNSVHAVHKQVVQGGKPQKTVFRGSFSRKSLKKLSNINYYYMALSHKDWELPNSRI